MHERKEIIKNQKEFRNEIIRWFKKDFKETKKHLYDIEVSDKKIEEAKQNLISKIKKVKLDKSFDIYFIHEKNITPKFYAWWDEETKNVEIYKYI